MPDGGQPEAAAYRFCFWRVFPAQVEHQRVDSRLTRNDGRARGLHGGAG